MSVESELQRIVDGLSRRLQRSVMIDDTEGRLLAHSPLIGAVDQRRVDVILKRHASAEGMARSRTFGIAEATGPVRIPAHPDSEWLARLCVPVRCQGELLAFLWLIDPDASLAEPECGAAEFAAEAVGYLLHGQRVAEANERERQRDLMPRLLCDEAGLRAQAALDLVRGGHFVAGAEVAVMVAELAAGPGPTPDEAAAALQLGLDLVCQGLARRRYLTHIQPGRGVLLMAPDPAATGPGTLGGLAERFHEMLLRASANDARDGWRVALGGTRPSLSEAATSYQQARLALQVARAIPSFGSVVAWERLGVYQTLAQFPFERLAPSALSPGLGRLLESVEFGWLAGTLESYLDHAGDARATARALGLHRGSLYYRLRKIEEVARVELRDGEQRLALHLGLKLARLVGALPPERTL